MEIGFLLRPKTKIEMATYNINVLCDNKAVNTAEFDIQSSVCKYPLDNQGSKTSGLNPTEPT